MSPRYLSFRYSVQKGSFQGVTKSPFTLPPCFCGHVNGTASLWTSSCKTWAKRRNVGEKLKAFFYHSTLALSCATKILPLGRLSPASEQVEWLQVSCDFLCFNMSSYLQCVKFLLVDFFRLVIALFIQPVFCLLQFRDECRSGLPQK